MLVVSLKNQLLPGPATTPGGGVYQWLPGTPASACDTNECTAGEATKTPSAPCTIVKLLFKTSPTQSPTAMSGVNAIVTASLKLSVVPVLAETMRSDQCRALLQPKMRQRFVSSAIIVAMMKATAGSSARRARWSGWVV